MAESPESPCCGDPRALPWKLGELLGEGDPVLLRQLNRLWRKPRPQGPDLVDEVSAALGDLDGPVVLLASRRTQASLPRWRQQFGVRLRLVVPERWNGSGDAAIIVGNRRDIVAVLSALPPVAAIIDDTESDHKALFERWQRFFLYLRKGGLYALPGLDPDQAWSLVTGDGGTDSDDRLGTELRESVARHPHSQAAVLVKSRDHVRMIGEAEADALLPGRHPELAVQTISSRPGGTWRTNTRVVSHNTGSPDSLLPPSKFDYPELRLRSYRGGVILGHRMLSYLPGSLLPPAFNHAVGHRSLKNRRTQKVDRRIATMPRIATKPERIEGPVFDLNCAFPGHFGHVVTESLAKLWAWDEAVARFPDLRAIYHLPPGETEPTFERELFRGAGVPEDRVIWARGDVRCDLVLSATLGWQNAAPRYAHPVMFDVWRGLRERLATEPSPVSDRVFVSRSSGVENRSCRNLDEVERFFSVRGFDVVYPEKLTIAEQAATFAGARTIAGFAGSAMFNMLYARKLERVIVLSHTSYTARNEWLYGCMLADDLRYFWSAADVPPAGHFTDRAFHSSWDFDFDGNAAELEAALTMD